MAMYLLARIEEKERKRVRHNSVPSCRMTSHEE